MGKNNGFIPTPRILYLSIENKHNYYCTNNCNLNAVIHTHSKYKFSSREFSISLLINFLWYVIFASPHIINVLMLNLDLNDAILVGVLFMTKYGSVLSLMGFSSCVGMWIRFYSGLMILINLIYLIMACLCIKVIMNGEDFILILHMHIYGETCPVLRNPI